MLYKVRFVVALKCNNVECVFFRNYKNLTQTLD